MEKSKSIARIVGPTLIVTVASELKIWNPTLYDQQIVPLVYLSGILFFVAGISIVSNHNVWCKGWPIAITIIGWMSILLGVLRAFLPQIYLSGFENNVIVLVVEVILLTTGVFITAKGYHN